MKRDDVFKYVKNKYNTEPEYLWSKHPSYAILRHQENNKWYCAVMNVLNVKLGLEGNGKIDIINVKCEPELSYMLRQESGILPAYHMNKEHWITVILDSHMPKKQIYELIDISYVLSKKSIVNCAKKQEGNS